MLMQITLLKFRPLIVTSDLSIQFRLPSHAQTYTLAIFECVRSTGVCALVLLIITVIIVITV